MKHKAKLTISRPISSTGEKIIEISVYDDEACIEFLEIGISLGNFAECLTGLSRVECEMEFRGLQNVGKMRETRPLEFEIHGPRYQINKADVIDEAKKYTPDGWTASEYYGSQGSFFSRDGKHYARTKISRWVDKEGKG